MSETPTYSMAPRRPRAIHFGAGNIGRGFIAPLLVDSGYHVTFADVDKELIEEMNAKQEYDVHILDQQKNEVKVTHVSAVLSFAEDLEERIAHAALLTTAVGLTVLEKIAPTIAKGIQARRKINGPPLNIIACENAIGGTAHLKEFVDKHLADEDQEYVRENVGFANCSVDRIVPPFEGKPGNKLDVGVEGFFEWVVEEPALRGPKLNVKGMHLTNNLIAYNERKLFTLNTGHCITAYLGWLKGLPTIDSSIRDDEIRKVVRGALDESGAALIKKHGFSEQEHKEYLDKIEERFKNPEVKDDVVRVGRQPLRKLGRNDRLLGPTYLAKEYGVEVNWLPVGIAAAFHYENDTDEQAKQLQAEIKAKGIENVVADITGFHHDTDDHKKIVNHYHELKKLRA
ncbi:mannitol-1-phosphate 5-dehydrogenase [Punctularia strigosozonata HHB-11173 SS5]|uniref:mannitol-1-phosphate 5-dehydrogenase n=1 Tax=Punctularia strigosozonata (strain HHB-11173) TaxID=741275 RepID=UPI0004416AF1|nr:mannitol-1-phosphate 5-dehydrogenase [Punctularia strigosozonata HHB-11173 SS5]EIN08339.1 mannitol-1-phosphate 5-dehydrogenase [Punctularia strigosozonata HHB-11173 SS5]